jgi:hypothetical protein
MRDIDPAFVFPRSPYGPPIWPDPGPEIYQMLGELASDVKVQALQAVLEAQADVLEARSAAFRKLASRLAAKR